MEIRNKKKLKSSPLRQRYSRKVNILTINASVRPRLNYSQFINQLAIKNISLDRTMLAQCATYEPLTFEALIKIALNNE